MNETTVRGTTGGWREYRCPACRRKQFVYAMELAHGMIEIKCNDPRCSVVSTLVFGSDPNPDRAPAQSNGRKANLPAGYELWRCPYCDHPHSWPSTLPAQEIVCPGCTRLIRIGR